MNVPFFTNRFAAVFALLLTLGGQVIAEPSLVPAPVSHSVNAGYFQPGDALMVSLPSEIANDASFTWLAGLLEEASGKSVSVSDSPAAEIQLKRISEHALRELFSAQDLAVPQQIGEAYTLDITGNGVVIQASGEAGLFYGLVSLWQLVSDQAGNWPAVSLLDAPQFEWRGLMLDSARHMQSVEFIKNYIDWMALHKLNTFHWHLTDDQAWRLEIKAYPKLTEVGGYRVPAGDAPAADIDPETGEPRLYGGYYTQDQVRDVVAHAASRHIQVIPEVDVPGHATAAIAAYPELGVEGHGIDSVPANWGIYHNVFNLEESTFDFLEAVLAEVVELFPAPFIHLGGDEVVIEQWEGSSRVADRMKELGIDDYQGLQNYYVERLQAFLDPHQRRVIGWDEILESDLPPHAAVMSWRGVKGAIEAAAKGHQTVLSPAPTLYLDHIQTAAADAPPGRGGVITTKTIYDFNPLPEELAGNEDKVLGLQGNLWTEHVRTEERAAYMTWPRAAAIAELGWTPAEQRDWYGFTHRLRDAVIRLQRLGVPAAIDAQAMYGVEPEPPADAGRREDRELELCSQSIVLAIEDDAPIAGERESFLVDINNPCWIWRDVDLAGLSSLSASVGQLPFNFEIGAAIHDVVVEKPAQGIGTLRVRHGSCDGPVVADLPLEPASSNPGVTTISTTELALPEPVAESADLCFSFTRPGVEPIWVIDWLQLHRE